MKKKVFSLLLCTVMLLCLLTGCIHQNMGVKLNKDGTGSITTTLGIEKEFYKQLKAKGSDPFEGKTVTEYQLDGSTYVSVAETQNYSSYEAMEQALLAMTYETEMLEDAQNGEAEEELEVQGVETSDDFFDVVIGEEGGTQPDMDAQPVRDNHVFSSVNIEKSTGLLRSTYHFRAVLNPQSSEGLDYDLNQIFKVTLSVEMPGKIAGSSGGTVDGNKVIFDAADISESQELVATCKDTSIGVLIALFAVADPFSLTAEKAHEIGVQAAREAALKEQLEEQQRQEKKEKEENARIYREAKKANEKKNG